MAKSKAMAPPKSSAVGQAWSPTADIATVADHEQSETPPAVGQLVVEQVSERLSSIKPLVQRETPSLIDQTLSMVEQSVNQRVANQLGVPVPPVQEQQSASLISRTMSMVAVVISKSAVSDELPSLQPPVENHAYDNVRTKPLAQGEQRAISQWMVTGDTPPGPELIKAVSPSLFQETANAGESIPPSQESIAKNLTPAQRLDIDRADMRKRVESFKANQKRFQREREEYCNATMEKVRTQLRETLTDSSR
ncbi:hypothetical protein [Bradyrhizobium sp. JYMT SZCCT0428]|uniref:hypothetical protein n=1 Tax=Bradyrhizobium sp. JYMT SZCCT0428 TaxID=2807673 RepID=UPI001BAB0690|nr:hypothetical protein [Bradyrhizobium sp. JYMT SZCCT0428]MBR1157425.1 hypothetical protein [Bradyrhizobium sp. JYMT SZCCT0428]